MPCATPANTDPFRPAGASVAMPSTTNPMCPTLEYATRRVEVARGELDKLGPAVELKPGMPAEVLIIRKERTMVDYLFEPLREAFRRSFREV